MLSAPLRIAVLCSARAPGLTHLLHVALTRPVNWKIVCCVTSEDTFVEQPEVAALDVPVVVHPVRRFYDAHAPQSRLSDLTVRERYDAQTAWLLSDFEPDVVLCSGYLLLLTAPMLKAYPNRIINVHHSDKYPGLRAVRDAIRAGERETFSIAHLVTARLDEGPVLARSHAFAVPDVARWARAHGEEDVLRRVIWAHQEWMLRTAFGPLMEQAINLLALRRVALAAEGAA